MLNEIKQLFNNIKNFRQLLKEGVGEGDIIDAIENNKILYIYYAGDNTTLKGYRTIKPFVLGKTSKGNLVLRAWQENGSSDSYAGLTGRKRDRHEYHHEKSYVTPEGIEDSKGGVKPGWRLFSVSGITSVLPTGKRFSIEFKNLPPYYNPNDKQMGGGIIAAVPKNAYSTLKTKGLDALGEPDVIEKQPQTADKNVNTSIFDKQRQGFSNFYNKIKDATADEIENLYGRNKQMSRQPANTKLVIRNKDGDVVLGDVRNKDKFDQNSIIGNLQDLYDKLVVLAKSDIANKNADNSFFTNGSKDVIQKLDNKISEKRNFFR